MEEIWRDIEGYEKLYQVSNFGNVRSLPRNTKKGRVLKHTRYKNGYLYLNLCKDGKSKHYYIHRLVAQAFLPNPDNLPQVNHRDENPSNNRVDNLEWCTSKYNNNYGSHNQKISEAQRGISRGPYSEETKRKKSIPVAQLTKKGELIVIFYGATEAERQTGIAHQSINACCIGKRKSAGGFVWKYV